MKGSGPVNKKVAFSLNAPEAQVVLLAGCFTDWERNALPLKRQKKGAWKTTVSLLPGTYHYRFLVDGQWWDDPACAAREPNPFGTEDCVLTVA
jgi:1,4-alpha-glucan branching enzyme